MIRVVVMYLIPITVKNVLSPLLVKKVPLSVTILWGSRGVAIVCLKRMSQCGFRCNNWHRINFIPSRIRVIQDQKLFVKEESSEILVNSNRWSFRCLPWVYQGFCCHSLMRLTWFIRFSALFYVCVHKWPPDLPSG